MPYLISALIALIATGGAIFAPQPNRVVETVEPTVGDLRILTAPQGGTGIGSATAGDVGKVIKVLDDSPFTYELAADNSGGGGSGGGTWSTTTSQVSGTLINYPNNATDVVNIGSNATTTGEFWFDPNTTSAWFEGGATTTLSFNSTGLNPAYRTGIRFFEADTEAMSLLYDGSGTGANNKLSIWDNTAGAVIERFTFLRGGNFGISTTSPYAALSVVGEAVARNFTSTTTLANTFPNASTTQLSIGSLLYFDSDQFDSLTDDATLDNNGGDLRVVDVTCTDCLSTTETDSTIAISARNLTVAGTANQITSSAGAQDLSADRTWTLSFPNLVIFPSNASSTLFSSTYASSTNQVIGGNLTFGGVTGSAWSSFCTAITGGAGLCDGTDATGAGGSGSVATSTNEVANQVAVFTSNSATPALIGGDTDFTFSGNKLTITQASSTLLSSLFSQFGATGTTTIATNGFIGFASSSPTYPLTVNAGSLLSSLVLTANVDNFHQSVIWNRNSGTNASSDYTASNDIGCPDAACGYYVDLGINSSTYNNATYGASGASDSYLYANDKALVIGTASTTDTTASLKFATGGFTSSNVRGVLTAGGFWGFGTTTPNFSLLTLATTTAPQLSLSAGGGFPQWAFRNAGGNLYIATTTLAGTATSTTPIISLFSSGTTTISGAFPATSTTYIYSTAAGKGGSIILEDVDAAGCTEVSALNGVLSAAIVTCPTEL